MRQVSKKNNDDDDDDDVKIIYFRFLIENARKRRMLLQSFCKQHAVYFGR